MPNMIAKASAFEAERLTGATMDATHTHLCRRFVYMLLLPHDRDSEPTDPNIVFSQIRAFHGHHDSQGLDLNEAERLVGAIMDATHIYLCLRHGRFRGLYSTQFLAPDKIRTARDPGYTKIETSSKLVDLVISGRFRATTRNQFANPL